jgi:putative salt-induced outer membrane protein
MSRSLSSVALGAALCLVGAPALAEWTGRGELGASLASGNSENESVNAAFEVSNAYDQWTHTLGFAGNYGSDGNDTTAQRWELRGQSDYKFTDRAYAFGAGRYEDDKFSAYDYQSSLAVGLGYRLIDEERTKLWVQGGPGYRFAERRGECLDVNPPDNAYDCNKYGPGESENSLIFRGDLGFDYQFTDTTKLVERFLVETGSDNTYLQNDLGVEVTITGAFALRVGFQVRYNTDVAPGIDKTDTLTTVGLIYGTRK